MANSYLVQLTPDDGPAVRRVVIQQWFEAICKAIRVKWRGLSPATGKSYLIDPVPEDSPQTVACADVAWVSAAAS